MHDYARFSDATLIEEVAVAANLAERPVDALAAALRAVCRHFAWDAGHGWIVVGQELTSSGVWYLRDSSPTASLVRFQSAAAVYRIQRGEELIGQVVVDGRPRWMPDLRAGERAYWQRAARVAGFVASLIFPVRAGTQVVGVLECYARSARPLEPLQLAKLGQVELQLAQVFGRYAIRQALGAAKDRLHAVLEQAVDAYVAMDEVGRITDWNPAAATAFGWSRAEIRGRLVVDTLVSPADQEACRQALAKILSGGGTSDHSRPMEITAVKKDGTTFPIELTQWVVEVGGQRSCCALLRDITQRRAAQHELHSQANYDLLTGLVNRASVMRQLTTLLGERRRSQFPFAVLFVDLDRFKQINDSLGHHVGDAVLKVVAKQLRSAVRPGDTVARLGGDEFLVICPGVDEAGMAVSVSQRILQGLVDPVRVMGDTHFLSASIGIAVADTDSSADGLIAAADMAMYAAKRDGRVGYVVFDAAMRTAATARQRTEGELRRALERNELKLYFQPIIDLADRHVAAVEALLRWEHPERGVLLPAEFIPIAEETGLIVAIGAWAIREACRLARQWSVPATIRAPLCLSINLSARQLAQPDLVLTIERALEEASWDPRYVELGIEMTEALAIRNLSSAAKVLQALHERGMRLSIDDFGTGYSSLAYLSRLPVDTLKIDLSFVQRAVGDPVNRAIVKTIVELGRSLGLKVVAEGVETKEQEAVLQELGVRFVQGFLYARPDLPERIFRAIADGRVNAGG